MATVAATTRGPPASSTTDRFERASSGYPAGVPLGPDQRTDVRVRATPASSSGHAVIDLHCHILPGIDDGPESLEASLAMARAQVAAGVHTVVATPHVSWNYGNTAGSIAPATDALQAAITDAGIPLRVLPGAEVALTRACDLTAEQLAELRIGSGPWLLLEPPIAVDSPGIEGMIGMVQSRGCRILLAHPERCMAFHSDPDLLARLVRSGCRAQVTAGSLTGAFGRTVQALAQRYVDAGLIHVVASDAHDDDYRAPGLRPEVDGAGYGPLAEWLTADVPTAILENRPLPPRPELAAAPRRRRAPWRRRA